ncbi:MAG: hypothetical protein COV31_02960 [Candidatus Yanofskybacteria bacterium CG10_big_fil_rev_8_21_14_0_10_46_23]|uniref:Uncharacterized protein n=1 Tax=Candidatus Yanofskybacteria bacterium CG10_big_fil_rev_8_21_14_0_10_46_23 TaxID=1975098 RepID=A0A2H0R3H6_9BACT|nr:MAG: hypothetical protein COV31_02960 [Candidatus Yanofskybacteria bacterium CG10_big_fil_rev_8_21_14_0_10_46_23]
MGPKLTLKIHLKPSGGGNRRSKLLLARRSPEFTEGRRWDDGTLRQAQGWPIIFQLEYFTLKIELNQ